MSGLECLLEVNALAFFSVMKVSSVGTRVSIETVLETFRLTIVSLSLIVR